MSSKKHHGKKLQTDKQTDYLFDYFMNEDKIDEQLKGQLDEELAKKIENHQPKLDSRVISEKPSRKAFSSEEKQELPSISPDSEDNFRPNVEFNDDDDEPMNLNSESPSSVKSPYGQKINASAPFYPIQSRPVDNKPKEIISERPILGEKLVADVQKYIETPEERRARARDAYSKLQDLVEKYQVKLSRPFGIDDDPDEMEAEYDMHKERRNKTNQVKFYKQILLNVVCGVEFLNDKYNPFEFKLKDWSKQVASDMDDYTEVLEEIYEKYKDRGGKMAPEIRLLFMIIMSGVTFHLSQALFGNGGLDKTVQNNPNILNKLLGGLMKGGGGILGGGNSNDEPPEAKEAAPNNKNILAAIRKHNQTKNSDIKSEATNTTEAASETSQKMSTANEALAIERERRLLAEQRAAFENQMRKQNEMYMAQINDLRNQLSNQNMTVASQMNVPSQVTPQNNNNFQNTNNYQNTNNFQNNSVNQVLSDASRNPRFKENPIISNGQYSRPNLQQQQISDSNFDMFASEIKEPVKPIQKVKNSSVKKPTKIRLDEILDSLGDRTTEDIDDVIETSSKNRNRKINSLSKPITSTKKPKNNSATRSVTASDKRNSNVLKI
ncbi:hypothetical protein QJ856_gp0618 [Tupanvirus deep ocean]|uniref:Uncharacterized protein n=2 Tax=Tupanvirus TaxID=2094720 RepID=A0AC62A8Y3_9VIRU|nr:hypothetical protein QJ856_gp0618 [Tupanvirus deep ocean]QKU34128.1 hypothetical protein [Tupanvirus deep ocean]